jgi:hypothetical protein
MKTSQRKSQWSFSRDFSDADNQIYIHTFTVLKDEISGKSTLIGELIYNATEGVVKVKVYDSNHETIYAPFYNRYYGNFSEILDKCQVSINRELKRLGIQDVNDYHCRV